MRAGLAGVLLLLCALAAKARAQSPAPNVLTTIKPVHSIASVVMAGIGSPSLLLGGAASPHSYALKPSDALKLGTADVIFWIGPELETFLARPIANTDARAVALASAPGMTRLTAREGGVWESEDEAHAHDHAHGAIDGHVWLDVRNGIAIANAMAAELGRRDPGRRQQYRANAARFAARMRQLDAELARRLEPLTAARYVVLHDAYHYFEERYGLSPAGAVTVAADRPAGARRVQQIRDRIRTSQVTCVIAPPQVSPRLLTALTEGTPARVAAADDLGAALPAGIAMYETLLRRMGDSFAACLGGQSHGEKALAPAP
jgi:zinc transport system substrate-binding protein